MAATLYLRAGTMFRAQLRYWQPDRSSLIDTSPYTATFKIQGSQPPYRTLLAAQERLLTLPTDPIPTGTILARLEPGSWRLTLGANVTRQLPGVCGFDLELVHNSDPNDITVIVTGAFRVSSDGATGD